MTVRTASSLGVLGLGFCLSCSGTILDGAEGSPIGNDGTQPTTPDPGNGRVACKGGIDPGPAVIRRLNRTEYNNTVRDLLGDTSKPARSFSPDSTYLGFDDHAATLSVSPVLVEDHLDTAERLAASALTRGSSTLLGCDPAKDGEDACAATFFATFGKRAYRRPLNAEDLTILTDIYQKGKASAAKDGFQNGIRLALTTMLMSAHFLYRVEFGEEPRAGETTTRLTSWEMASRLSYLIWRSMPDPNLMAAAEAGKLGTAGEIEAQATRMLVDPKARSAVDDFHQQWLGLTNLESVTKDATVFPTFTTDIPALMKQETQKFVDDVVWQGDGTLEALYTAPFTFANATLARFYKLPWPLPASVTNAGFRKISTETQPRGGLLTQGGLLSVLAKVNKTGPVQRGRFVRERLLCDLVPDPPKDVNTADPTVQANDRTLPRCAGCHRLMDPIGSGFENFDGVGVYRASENGKPIAGSGEVVGMPDGKFDKVMGLGRVLAGSEKASDCMVKAWFRYGYGRMEEVVSEKTNDACSFGVLKNGFARGGFKVRDLLAALTRTDAFQYRRVIVPGGAQ